MSIFKIEEFDYISLKNTEKSEIKKYNNVFLHYKGIPSVIDTSKKYSRFKLLEANKEEDIIILVNYKTEKKIKVKIFEKDYKELIKNIDPSLSIGSFEQVGTIIHLNLTEEQLIHGEKIGEILLQTKNITSVISKVGNIESEYRNYKIKLLAGEKNFKTIHRESGYKFFIDLENVYWCSKLQNERLDLLKEFEKGETVLDGTCGVGPIAIPALKKGCRVLYNDINPDALKCLKKNIKLNKVENTSYQEYSEDCLTLLEKIKNEKMKVDHFIFNLPEYSLKFTKKVLDLKLTGKIHAYFFCRTTENYTEFLKKEVKSDLCAYKIKKIRKVSPTKEMYKLTVKLE